MIKSYITILLIILHTSVLASNNINLNASAGLTLDDNITRAKLTNDVIDDTILMLGLSADYKWPVNDNSKIITSLLLDINDYQDISKWSFFDLAAQVDYQIKPGQGYTAPWYFLTLSLGQLSYDSNQRDSTYINLGAGIVKRFTDTINLRFAIDKLSIDADEPIGIFDLDTLKIYLNIDYKFNSKNLAYLTFGYTDGDIVTTVLDSSPINADLAAYPWAVDDIFPAANWWSYKLDASTLSLSLGHNYAINSSQSIDASFLYYDTDAYANSDYDGIILQFSYLHRF